MHLLWGPFTIVHYGNMYILSVLGVNGPLDAPTNVLKRPSHYVL